MASTSLKQWRTTHPRDVEHGGPVVVSWRKAQWRCRNAGCERKAFTDSVPQVPPGARLTERLRERVGAAVGAEVSVSGAARSHGVSWPVARAAHASHADAVLAAAGFEQERLARRAGVKSLVRVLGIDETRRGRPAWHQDETTGRWRLSERFETNFVDLGDGHRVGPVPLLGQTAGRTVAAVSGWLDGRGQAWKDQVDVVAIDLSQAYLSAVTASLPGATVVADHFHVQRLGNQMLTRVRQRVTRELPVARRFGFTPVA